MPCRPLTESPYQCFLCTFVGTEASALRKHIERDHSRSNYFWCKWCGKASSCLDEHITHLESEQCTDVYEHPCGFDSCTYSTNHPTPFIAHLKNAHKGKSLIPCAYCRRLFTLPPCLISHIQNECCNRPTSSSSPNSLPKLTRDDDATSSYNNQDSAVSSSTSKPPISTDDSSKPKRKGSSSPEKRKNKPSIPTWNPFGLNKDFISGNDSDSTGSTLSNENTKSGSGSGQKRKSPSLNNSKPEKYFKQSDNESSENEFSVKPRLYNTWPEWLDKMRKYKSPDDVEVFLKKERAEHFFKCMQKSCTHSSHDNMNFTLHLFGHHKGQKLKCFYCFSTFQYTEMLVKHMVARHLERRWQCNTCLYRASSKTHVKAHQRIVHAGEDVQIIHCKRAEVGGLEEGHQSSSKTRSPCSYNCRVLGCNFSTLITVEFRDHLLKKHKNINYFTCCYCEFETTKLEQLVNHYRKHEINQYECCFCTFGAEMLDDVLTHVCINHADNQVKILSRLNDSPGDFLIVENTKSSTNDSIYSSDSCSSNSVVEDKSSSENVTNKRNDSNHGDSVQKNDKESRTKSSTSGSPKLTPNGSKHSKSNDSLSESSPNTKGAKSDKLADNTLLICEHCDKTYTYEKAFKTHSKVAHGVNVVDNYECSLCDFKSFALSRVQVHAKFVHTGQTCNIRNDSKPARKTNTKGKKTTTKPVYICMFCDTSFESELHLTEHLHSELGYNKYTCKHCDFKHYRRIDVTKHSKVKHAKVIPYVVSVEKQNYEDWIKNYVQVQTNKSADDTCIPMLRSPGDNLDEKCCKMCKMVFSSKDLLKSHIFQHLQYTPHHCTICSHKFTSLVDAEEHSKSVHHTTKRSTKLVHKPIDKIEVWTNNLLHPDWKQSNDSLVSPSPNPKKNERKRRRFPAMENDVSNEPVAGMSKTPKKVSAECEDSQHMSPKRDRAENENDECDKDIGVLSINPEKDTQQHIIKDTDARSVSTVSSILIAESAGCSTAIDDSVHQNATTGGSIPPEAADITYSNPTHITKLGLNSQSDGDKLLSSYYYDDDDSSSDDYELPDIVSPSGAMSDSDANLSNEENDSDNLSSNCMQLKSSHLETRDRENTSADRNQTSLQVQEDKKTSSEQLEEKPTSSAEVHEEKQKSSEVHEEKQKSSEVHEEKQKSSEVHEEKRESSEVHEGKLESLKVPEETNLLDIEELTNLPNTVTPMKPKQTARKSFVFSRNSDFEVAEPIFGINRSAGLRQTARKSCSSSRTAMSDRTSHTSASGFKATARKSTSKPAKCLQRSGRSSSFKYVFSRSHETLDYKNVFYVPKGNTDVKIYNRLFPKFFKEFSVCLRNFKEIL